jgi:hypothetical protein
MLIRHQTNEHYLFQAKIKGEATFCLRHIIRWHCTCNIVLVRKRPAKPGFQSAVEKRHRLLNKPCIQQPGITNSMSFS